VVFVDETPFRVFDTRHIGRAPVGQRAIVRRRRVRTDSVTAITAISEAWGVVHVQFVLGGVTADVFRVFLSDLFETLRGLTSEAVLLITDNVQFHKAAQVVSTIGESGHRVLYTAPWSCELNPIEYVFGFVKSRVRVPPDVSNTRDALPYLVEAFRSATRVEVARTVRFVTTVLFSRAWESRDLQLRATLRDIGSGTGNDIDMSERSETEDDF